ncbi:hypothetical protein TCAL_01437 [Tigriopus californicus]|uniref:Methyltransferase-like protein 17, mitochondrial n=1 Tax=Tigriopus californicus TaxID=6832 RepID=A0A553N8B3_TIGCA|nr:methyltransferase-like protein 17, mitochondrial [Tigriopus californicus]TRY61681.1 hypothetical protein TCAL_01437 [Tigriopus californicus]
MSNWMRLEKLTRLGPLCGSYLNNCRLFHLNHVRLRKRSIRKKMFPFDVQNRPALTLDPDAQSSLETDSKIKNGSRTLPIINPPEKIAKTVEILFSKDSAENPIRPDSYLAAGVKLWNFLHSRKLPLELTQINHLENQFKRIIIEKEYQNCPDDLLFEQSDEIERKARKMLESKTNTWKSVVYDDEAAKAYLLARAPFDYSAVYRTMSEIKKREPDFQPRTIFDFGSGVGTCIWAANSLFGEMSEIFAVDPSSSMNDLARAILLQGKTSHSLPAGHFFRLNCPTNNDLTYDLVTSAFTLAELPSAKARLTSLDILWRKTHGYLILLEDGSNAGFQILAEARDYLLQLVEANAGRNDQIGKELHGHLFAPCPHSQKCPRYFEDNIPCNFDTRYENFKLNSIPNEITHTPKKEKFCYLIFKKGPEPEADKSYQYPRVVEEPMMRKKHVVCRMCTHRGKLEEFVATKGPTNSIDTRMLYQHVKRIHCGDQLKVQVQDKSKESLTYVTWKERKAMWKQMQDEISPTK